MSNTQVFVLQSLRSLVEPGHLLQIERDTATLPVVASRSHVV